MSFVWSIQSLWDMETLHKDIESITQDRYFGTVDFWCLEWKIEQG